MMNGQSIFFRGLMERLSNSYSIMEEKHMDNIEAMFKNVEQIMRYLVPSFVLTILLKFCAGDGYFFDYFFGKISDLEFFVYFILSGITLYSIHRLLWEVVDLFLFKYGYHLFKWCNLYKDIANYIKSTYTDENDKKEGLRTYFYYKTATIHSVLLSTEITILFLGV